MTEKTQLKMRNTVLEHKGPDLLPPEADKLKGEIEAFGKQHDIRQTDYRAMIHKDRWETIRQELEAAGVWWASLVYPIDNFLIFGCRVVAGDIEVVLEPDPYCHTTIDEEWTKSLFEIELGIQSPRMKTEYTTLH